MKNKELIEMLEDEYSPDDSISVEIDLPQGLSETNYHRGTWKDTWDFTCTSDVFWKRGRLKTDYMDVSDLVELLKEKDLPEMSGGDFPDIELVETSGGHTEVYDIEWEETPGADYVDEFDPMDLYNESEITDCEYKVEAGTIGSLTVTIRKDTLTIDPSGYNLTQAPRIRKWTEEDKADFENRTVVAMAELIEIQSMYDLMLDSGVSENLPSVEMEGHEAPALRVARFEVGTENDVLGKEVVAITVWAQNGPAFKMQLTGLGDAIRLRNMLARQVDGFGRPFSQSCEVDEAYDPPVEYDFGTDDDADSAGD